MQAMTVEETLVDVDIKLEDDEDPADATLRTLIEPMPHYPVGSLAYEECNICYQLTWLHHRACCNYSSCGSCLREYYASKVELAIITIECINSLCHDFVHRDEIAICLDDHMKSVYYRLLVEKNSNGVSKTCPKCNHITTLNQLERLRGMEKDAKSNPLQSRIHCSECQFLWCFLCYAPWHENLTCKQYKKGDRLLKLWAKGTSQGSINAQRCPQCKIFIQRTTGCDHMHCIRCKTDFCYRCGDQLRRLKFFGDHYSKLSIFGCKYRYKPDRPIQRKVIRGAVFGSKVMVAPVLGSLAVCAGVIIVGVGVTMLPIYVGSKVISKYKTRQHLKRQVIFDDLPAIVAPEQPSTSPSPSEPSSSSSSSLSLEQEPTTTDAIEGCFLHLIDGQRIQIN